MDPRSEKNLAEVEPELGAVIRNASQAEPFIVIYGIRTVEAERKAVASGHSQTMHSRHLPDKTGKAAAVDVMSAIHGFAPGHEAVVFGAIARAIKASADELGIPIEWGGNWHSLKDWGHFQLPWAYCP